MPKIKQQWLLYTFVEGEFTPLSRAFETREQEAQGNYPEKERRRIGVGVIQSSS
jgi:hypothetical protein